MRNFTFVTDHRANIEIHATGCRDLAHLPESSTRWDVQAVKARDAVKAEELPDVKVMACTNPIRMDAAGRHAVIVPEVTEFIEMTDPRVEEEQDAPEVEAEPVTDAESTVVVADAQ